MNVFRLRAVPLLAISSLFFLSGTALAEPRFRAVTLAYFGEFIFHPGARVGAEVTLFERGRHSLLGVANLTTYHHPSLSTGLSGDIELGYRASFDNGLFLELRGGIGYLHTFLAGTTFEREASGALRSSDGAGNPGVAPSGTAGLGFDLSRRTRAPIELFLRFTAFGQYPNNEAWVPHVAAQLGLAFRAFR